MTTLAERRMFAKTIIDSDAFLDMPMSTQNLYFHLGMRADDDGFINNPKKIQRMIGASDDDLKLLIAKRFVIPFESGVCVIKHWKIHNYIQKDRYKETVYQEEKKLIATKKNGAYTLTSNISCTECIHDGYVSETQVRLELGKDSLEQEIGKDREVKKDAAASVPAEPPKHKYGEYGWVRLTESEYQRLIDDFGDDTVTHYIKYVDESAEQTGNKNKWKNWNLTVRKAIRDKWGVNSKSQSASVKTNNSSNASYDIKELEEMISKGGIY